MSENRFFSRLRILGAAAAIGCLGLFGAGFENAAAQFQNNQQGTPAQGFTGPAAPPSTAAQAKEMWDDTRVILRGNIVQALGGEHYLFRDQSGEIVLEIDHEKWVGLQVGPEDTVEIYGEVEKDFIGPVKIDVDRMIKR